MKDLQPDPLPQIAPSELDVMKVLWRQQECSAREVHEQLETVTGWAYSTTRTTLDRMVRKGLVARRSFHGLHLYGAAISRARGLARLVREFADRVLEAGPAPVLAWFEAGDALSADELDELRRLVGEEDRR